MEIGGGGSSNLSVMHPELGPALLHCHSTLRDSPSCRYESLGLWCIFWHVCCVLQPYDPGWQPLIPVRPSSFPVRACIQLSTSLDVAATFSPSTRFELPIVDDPAQYLGQGNWHYLCRSGNRYILDLQGHHQGHCQRHCHHQC